MHNNFAKTVDLLALAMQTRLPCEAHARVRTLDSLDNMAKPARTFGVATTTLEEWSYQLRVHQETSGTKPEPHRAWLSVSSLVSHLMSAVSDFSIEWSVICRTMKMAEGTTGQGVGLLAGARVAATWTSRRSQDAPISRPVLVAARQVARGHARSASRPRALGRRRRVSWCATRPGTTPGQLQRC